MNRRLYNQLLKFIEYSKNPCIVIGPNVYFSFDSMNEFMEIVRTDSWNYGVEDLSVNHITIQKSLFSDYCDVIAFYLK